MEPLREPLVAREHLEAFTSLVHAGFKQPRKTMLNSLADGLGTERAETTGLLHAAGIDPSVRPQAVTLEQWVDLLRVAR
jgi:16S rRNA A1518/A1519 N6-dimethyltransferase RsmA/KsgA/DIM1 with predicted DNA glycosylase/AP lyase activity